MGQLDFPGDVSDGVNTGNICLHGTAHRDGAFVFRQLHPGLLQLQAVQVGRTPNRHQHLVCNQIFRAAAGLKRHDALPILALADLLHPDSGTDVHLSLQILRQHLHQIRVRGGQNLLLILQHINPLAQRRVNSGKLHTDHAASHNRDGVEILLQIQRRGGIKHIGTVNPRDGKVRDPRSGGNDHMTGLDRGAV